MGGPFCGDYTAPSVASATSRLAKHPVGKYDNENLGCGINGQVVGFGGVTKIRKVPELIQGLFTLDFGYLWYMLIFILFDEYSQYLH